MWGGRLPPPVFLNQTRRSATYCGRKMVLTMGATLMRAHLERDFEHIDHLDLHGDRRQNPKISCTSHNVFGIQLGVGITLAVKKKGANKQVRYHRVPEMWRRGEKLEYLVSGKVPWRTLIPDAKHTSLVPAHGDEYGGLLAIKSMFALQSLGLNTNRDEVVFDFDRSEEHTSGLQSPCNLVCRLLLEKKT